MNTFLRTCLACIPVMVIFSSCLRDPDVNELPKPSIVNPLAGNYKVSGTVYNYIGAVSWPGPPPGLGLTGPASIPPGYVSTVDLSPFSPKTATVIDSANVTIPWADVVSTNHYYRWTFTPITVMSFSYMLSPVMMAAYSNQSSYLRAYTWPAMSPNQKMSVRILTHYNDKPGGSGNDHIVDEVFEQQ